MSQKFRDVEQFSAKPAGAGSGSVTKASLLNAFRNTFMKPVLYKKKGRRYVEVLPNDSLSVDGYFLTKKTLRSLLNAIGPKDGYVLVNFALGDSPDSLKELQLVLTATRTNDTVDDTDMGLICFTTAPLGNPTDPPLTGDPHPKPGSPGGDT